MGCFSNSKWWVGTGGYCQSQRHGLSQRAQSFVTDPADGPFNVIEPANTRVTLTPTLAMKDGKPFLAFAVRRAVTVRIKTYCSFLERGRVWYECPAGCRSGKHQQFSNA